MLRITVALNADEMWMRLEGRLIGPWVEELRRAWTSTHNSAARRRVHIDLSGVTFVCAEGKELLTRMAREGAEFHATDVVNQATIAEIGGDMKSSGRPHTPPGPPRLDTAGRHRWRER